MGGSTIATSETRIEALKLQSSAFGVTIPVLGGVNRIPGNLIWYGDFKATPHTSVQDAGGKGGGVKTQNTTYTYSASVLMGICQGPVGAIARVWKGKEVFEGGWSAGNIASASESYTPPGSGAMAYTLAHGATLIGAPVVGYSYIEVVVGESTNWETQRDVVLAEGTDYTLAGSVITILRDSLRGQPLSVQYQWGSGTPDLAPLVTLGITLANGNMAQAAPAWLTSAHPGQALAYPGLAYVHAQDYGLGSGAQVDNHNFEVQGAGAYRYGAASPDCNPWEFAAGLLSNGRYGARMPADTVEVSAAIDYAAAAGLLMSPLLTEQQRAGDFIAELCRFTNCAPVWSYDRLRIVPFGDVAVTGNGVTYTPNVTPVYDIDDNAWLQEGTDDPLQWQVKEPSDRFNHVKVEFNDRANYYNKTIAEAKDDADIAVNGLRTMDTISAPWICDAAVAGLVARIVMQRSLNISGTGTLKLPWAYCLLEPMDLLTLTDEALGFAKLPVSITEIGEDEDGMLEVEVEDWPLGSASPTRYPNQAAAGFQHNYNGSPGNVDAPVFFEAPVDRTVTGLEVYAAVKGSGALWGGCNVWLSLDGNNYKRVSTVYGGARYGRLTGPISAGAMPVATSGQLISGSATDAAALSTLCWVGGAVQEYLAFQTATLTGAGAYTLSALVRGAYATSAASAHATNDPFVRVDDAIAKSGPLDLALIGQTISLKFTSFNIFQAGEQSLADVPAYTYAITGAMAQLPPGAPTGLAYTLEPFGARLKCDKNPEPDVQGYEWRLGAVWDTAQVLDKLAGTSHSLAVQVTGTYTVWVAAVDALGNVSTPSSMPVVIAAPTIASIAAAIVGADLQLDYAGAAGAFALASYELRYGSTWVGGTSVGVYNITRLSRRVDWAGARRWWVAPIDARGNVGTPASVDVTITAPGAVTGPRSEVVDNNALLYWGAPATGSLPIDRYEVRKGATWLGGTVVGSNGNSTFGTVFEQQAGAYSYWVAAFDTAGTIGTPVAITATISQPPDYVLRADYNDDFSGITLSGMYLEGGRLYGPALGETIQTHFESRSWATPDAQIAAGYPLVFQPSGTSGYCERTMDYGTALPATIITVTPSVATLAGAVTMAAQVSYKALAGDPWIDAAAGALQVLASGFRYVKVRLTFTAAGGDDLVELQGLNIKLSGKLKTDSGGGSAVSTDSGGTAVSFGVAFIDVDSITVTPSGTSARYAVYDFVDAPNPTGFKVLLFDSSGARVSGAFSWTARGY